MGEGMRARIGGSVSGVGRDRREGQRASRMDGSLHLLGDGGCLGSTRDLGGREAPRSRCY